MTETEAEPQIDPSGLKAALEETKSQMSDWDLEMRGPTVNVGKIILAYLNNVSKEN